MPHGPDPAAPIADSDAPCESTEPGKGAGTFRTGTFLRSSGPEPWRAAYVQRSRRPKDGRYGENPNRLQHYYQYQVVLNPSPPDTLAYSVELDPLIRQRRPGDVAAAQLLQSLALVCFDPDDYGAD